MARPRGKRKAHELELWGPSRAAAHLGKRQSNLRTLKGLPEPYERMEGTTLYRAWEIREFKSKLDGKEQS